MSRYFTLQSNLLQGQSRSQVAAAGEPLCFNARGVDLEPS